MGGFPFFRNKFDGCGGCGGFGGFFGGFGGFGGCGFENGCGCGRERPEVKCITAIRACKIKGDGGCDGFDGWF